MTVIVLTSVPPGLRGHLTRWLLEISPGVYIGHVTSRVRKFMWARVIEFVENGRALMVYSMRNEQRLAFEVHGAWLAYNQASRLRGDASARARLRRAFDRILADARVGTSGAGRKPAARR